jgi:uncharacterized membrane protein AbrB (regulator of aidB expression)
LPYREAQSPVRSYATESLTPFLFIAEFSIQNYALVALMRSSRIMNVTETISLFPARKCEFSPEENIAGPIGIWIDIA